MSPNRVKLFTPDCIESSKFQFLNNTNNNKEKGNMNMETLKTKYSKVVTRLGGLWRLVALFQKVNCGLK